MSTLISMKFLYLSLVIFQMGSTSVSKPKDIIVKISYNQPKSGDVYKLKAKDVSDFTIKISVTNNYRKPIHAFVNVTASIDEVAKSDAPVEDLFKPWGPVSFRARDFEAMKHKNCYGCGIHREIKVFQPWENDFDPEYIVGKDFKIKFTVQVLYLKFGYDEYIYEDIEQEFSVVIKD